MAHPNNIIHRRRQARNAHKDALRAAEETPVAPEPEKAKKKTTKKRIWSRKKKS
jgi:hypothetical protein